MKGIMNLTTLILICLSGSVKASEHVDSAEIFEQMKSWVGTWTREGANNSNFSVEFELTANDTVLIETWLSNGNKHSLTLYHLNGDHLMATHYCPQGNQPRMHLSKDSTLNELTFSFLDATNLTSPKMSHQHSLGFKVASSAGKLIRKESYLSQSGEEHSELILLRQ